MLVWLRGSPLTTTALWRTQTGCIRVQVNHTNRNTPVRYVQIEKEALALMWACERLLDYLIGMTFHIHTHHKPLVPVFSTKHVEELPI